VGLKQIYRKLPDGESESGAGVNGIALNFAPGPGVDGAMAFSAKRTIT
jgi:hypothetical protein